jgi:hypothetical protein
MGLVNLHANAARIARSGREGEVTAKHAKNAKKKWGLVKALGVG